MKETFALYLEESIMFTTIFSLALRKTGTKTKLASSLLIMTKVGGAIGPVIMGYIANATGSMAIAFLIPMVCYGVIGGYALLNRHVSFWIKGEFSKITPSLFTLKEGSTSHPCPLSSGAREKTALLGARSRYALRLADQNEQQKTLAAFSISLNNINIISKLQELYKYCLINEDFKLAEEIK